MVVMMKIFGSSINIGSFKNHWLQLLDEAGLDYNKAFFDVEIYLGKIFEKEANDSKDELFESNNLKVCSYQIFITEIDNYRQWYGEKAVKALLRLYLGYELGAIIQKKYLPVDSIRWKEIEENIGIKFNFNDYCSKSTTNLCSSRDIIAELFDSAIKGHDVVYIPRNYTCTSRIEQIKINPHVWREWFYSLWDQGYDWGCIELGKKEAEANGYIYQFDIPPRKTRNGDIVLLGSFLKAHGFRYRYIKDDVMEYWR